MGLGWGDRILKGIKTTELKKLTMGVDIATQTQIRQRNPLEIQHWAQSSFHKIFIFHRGGGTLLKSEVQMKMASHSL